MAQEFLYRITTLSDWTSIHKSESEYIHLATMNQVPQVLETYWKKKPHIILKVDKDKLSSNLTKNTRGYYHFFGESLPHESIKQVLARPDNAGKLTDDELASLHAQGFVPGPGEQEDAFIHRAEDSLSLLLEYNQNQHSLETSYLEEAKKESQKLYDIRPSWIPLVFSNDGLSFFHGGCMWIMRRDGGKEPIALIQLREAFRENKTYLGLYERTELLTHEILHAGRIAFEEPSFEELITYRSSKNTLRKFLGPVISHTWEVWLFLATIAISLFLSLLAFADLRFFSWAVYASLLPPLLLLTGGIRLWQRWQELNTCLKRLRAHFGERADFVLYRLSDEEIRDFGQNSISWVEDYIRMQSCLRWRAIRLSYS